MQKTVIQCFLLSLSLLLQATYADESSLTRLHQFLQTKTFKASFTQRVYDEQLALIDDSKGRFIVSKPGRFRWEYFGPSRQIITSDGVNLINYDPELEQATVQPLSIGFGYSPIMILLDDNPSFDDFTVDVGDYNKDGLDWVTLTPKVQDIEFTRIELGLNQWEVKQIIMRDHFNQMTKIEFSALAYDPKLDEDLLHLYLPKGTDIIGEYLISP